MPRQFLFATGEVTITVNQPQEGRVYTLPEGTVLVTAGAPVVAFFTTAPVQLSAAAPSVTVAAQAFDAGPQGDAAPNTITAVDPLFQQLYLSIVPPTTLTVTNPQAFTGGSDRESDESYRARLLGFPRNIWTLERGRGSRSCRCPAWSTCSCPTRSAGWTCRRATSTSSSSTSGCSAAERRLGEPYFFDVVVAHEFARPWRTEGLGDGHLRAGHGGGRPGPAGRHPPAGGRGRPHRGRRPRPGDRSSPATTSRRWSAAFTERVAADVGGLRLGGDVLYSQVMRAFVEEPGVIDVQNLHLRRCPPAFGRITFGAVPFQDDGDRGGRGREPGHGTDRDRRVPARQRPARPGGDAAMTAAVDRMAGRLTVPFQRGADRLALRLSPGAGTAQASIAAYDFAEHAARFDADPDPRYVVTARLDVPIATRLTVDYQVLQQQGPPTSGSATLLVPAGTLAGMSAALHLDGDEGPAARLVGLTMDPPPPAGEAAAAARWEVTALLGNLAKLLWVVGWERDSLAAYLAQVRTQSRLAQAVGQTLDLIGFDLGVPRFPPLPYAFEDGCRRPLPPRGRAGRAGGGRDGPVRRGRPPRRGRHRPPRSRRPVRSRLRLRQPRRRDRGRRPLGARRRRGASASPPSAS